MPSPQLVVRVTDPDLWKRFLAVTDRNFEGSKTDCVMAALQAFLGSESKIVTRPGKSVSGVKPRPRKTTRKKAESRVECDHPRNQRTERATYSECDACGKRWERRRG